ncbi:MAG: hypothetical protein FWD53_03125 [Phycisphaerales bacterium]|nr:hypothetical protein [Phycisphaerales bacterium]
MAEIKKLAQDVYNVELALEENFGNLDRWAIRDEMGKWEVKNGGVEGEWITGSPSIFLKEKIKGDFMWEIVATRLQHDQALTDRFHAIKHGKDGKGLDARYNFNFWIRADAPPGQNFLEAYPRYLKTGWNGMGDDHWHAYFNTIVWDECQTPPQNWSRLRRSPGYEKMRDAQNIVPFMTYGKPHKFSFVICDGRVKTYIDDTTPVYDFADPQPYQEGHIGLCVWICKVRFEKMKLWRIVK